MLTQLVYEPSTAFKCLVLGVLLPIGLQLLPDESQGSFHAEPMACLATLVLTDTVRALASSQLQQHPQHVETLVCLVADPRRNTARYAAAACAILMLDRKCGSLLQKAGALSAINGFLTRAIDSSLPGTIRYYDLPLPRPNPAIILHHASP